MYLLSASDLLGLRSSAHKPQGFGASDRLPVSPACLFVSLLHRGVDLRRFYKHFSVVITVPLVLFAGVFRLFCISWRPRGLDSSPRFFSLQQLSRLLSFSKNNARRLQRWFVFKIGFSFQLFSPVTTAANPFFSIFSDTTRSVPPGSPDRQ